MSKIPVSLAFSLIFLLWNLAFPENTVSSAALSNGDWFLSSVPHLIMPHCNFQTIPFPLQPKISSFSNLVPFLQYFFFFPLHSASTINCSDYTIDLVMAKNFTSSMICVKYFTLWSSPSVSPVYSCQQSSDSIGPVIHWSYCLLTVSYLWCLQFSS